MAGFARLSYGEVYRGRMARIPQHLERSPLQPLYSIEGKHDLSETILGHLEGYRQSNPVRIGNAASLQMQLDIYGELMDAVYLFNRSTNR